METKKEIIDDLKEDLRYSIEQLEDNIEISPEYAKIIKQRLDWGSGLDTQWIDDNSPVKDEAKE